MDGGGSTEGGGHGSDSGQLHDLEGPTAPVPTREVGDPRPPPRLQGGWGPAAPAWLSKRSVPAGADHGQPVQGAVGVRPSLSGTLAGSAGNQLGTRQTPGSHTDLPAFSGPTCNHQQALLGLSPPPLCNLSLALSRHGNHLGSSRHYLLPGPTWQPPSWPPAAVLPH